MLRRKKLLIELSLACLISSGCATVRVPNVEWCTSIGIDGALCQNSLSNDNRQLTLDEWLAWLDADVEAGRGPALCVSSDDFTRLKIALEQLCYRAGRYCTRDTKKKMTRFFRNMDTLQYESSSFSLKKAD